MRVILFYSLLILTLFTVFSVDSQENPIFNAYNHDDISSINLSNSDSEQTLSYPILINQDTLFFYSTDFGSFTAHERADLTSQKIFNLLENSQTSDTLYIKHSEYYSEIYIGEISLITITDRDADFIHSSRDQLVNDYYIKLKNILSIEYNSKVEHRIIRDIIIFFLVFLLAFALVWLILKFSYKFELILIKLHEKENIFINILPNQKINLKRTISAFVYFYNGLKMILITCIIIFSIRQMLHIAGIGEIWNFRPITLGVLKAIILTILTYYILKFIKHILFRLYHSFNNLKSKIMEKMHLKTISFISEEKLIVFAKHCVKFLHSLAVIIVVYFYITLLFSFFIITETWAGVLFGYITFPVIQAFHAFVDYLPNVFIILIIILLIKFLLKIILLVFTAIEKKAFTIPGFFSDWAMPTFKIVKFMVIIFAAIVIFPYLPGSDSPFFRGITVFIGVLFSLGSTSAVANIISGVVLTYMRPFKIGDRVKIAETMGDVMEKSLLVTRVRTVKNVDITIPNAMVLSSHIINYSSSSEDTALIVHSTVTMGYEVEWRLIHDLMIQSALATDLILKEPKPFVLQTALDDFYVKYEINAFTKHPEKMAFIYTELHQNIQDIFGEAGLELLSPIYNSLREGNKKAIADIYQK
ncbi:MAG: mechanosensitive ion channel family protein [Candidatus Cloacimonetes bacterium]|nr:mechanosensitive ion channel family protein [Candidatus Cloacimonadota bacterium]